jgi:hypothetical protein
VSGAFRTSKSESRAIAAVEAWADLVSKPFGACGGIHSQYDGAQRATASDVSVEGVVTMKILFAVLAATFQASANAGLSQKIGLGGAWAIALVALGVLLTRH